MCWKLNWKLSIGARAEFWCSGLAFCLSRLPWVIVAILPINPSMATGSQFPKHPKSKRPNFSFCFCSKRGPIFQNVYRASSPVQVHNHEVAGFKIVFYTNKLDLMVSSLVICFNGLLKQMSKI
ncbi:hypothetical protein AAHE18_18G162400 [Arachis hypogaea]